jgi:hypothetical protein
MLNLTLALSNYCMNREGTITINVPVVYMAQDVMTLMGENPFRGQLEGVGPENQDFFGPEMGKREARAILTQKSWDFQGSPLPMARVMDFPPSKSLNPSAI